MQRGCNVPAFTLAGPVFPREGVFRNGIVRTGRRVDPTVTAQPRKLLINGQWVEALDGETFETFDPGTGEVLAHVAHGKAADIDLAVKAARAALDGPWSRLTPSERGRILHRLGDLIAENTDELAELESLDNGKARTVAAGADVPLAADLFWCMAGWATKLKGSIVTPSLPYIPGGEFLAYTLKEPVGVIGQVIRWNFPLLMAAWKVGPALTCGNTVVLKPAEQTPLTAIRLGELALEAGLPDGVLNVITGFGDAGARLAEHDDVDKVAFTGSTEVGKLIAQAAGRTNLKKVTLELGGKSPNIVLDDADVEAAIAGAAQGIFFNQGEVCTAGSRLFIHQDLFDEVVDGVTKAAENIKVGHGLQPDTEMGPLVSTEQFDRVTNYLKIGADQGAQTRRAARRSMAPGTSFAQRCWSTRPPIIV
jgi:phenylacetaldehyde dehydrogenase